MTHRNVARKVSALLAATVLASLGLSWGLGQIGGNEVAHAAGKPNILFIILDDVGIDQMSLFGFGGKPTAKLPNIAKLAKRGVKFSNVWAMPECSPSRASFFTGRYPIRTGVQSAIVVTQSYHLPRAVYTCRGVGIDAAGLGVPDWGTYPDGQMARYQAREVLASVKAMWDVDLGHPDPRFLGPHVQLNLQPAGEP